MRAVAASILHILAVHYLFVLFVVGVPSLAIGLVFRKKRIAGRYSISWLFYAVFLVCLAGIFLFPIVNVEYLKRYGRAGRAVVVNSIQQPAWFRRTPELRLLLKIAPEQGIPYLSYVTVTPSISDMDYLGVGSKVDVLYSPDYEHNIVVTGW